VEAEVEQQKNQLVVLVTTDDEAYVPELRRRAREMAKEAVTYPSTDGVAGDASGSQGSTKSSSGDMSESGSKSSSTADASSSSSQPIEVKMTAHDIKDGVRLVITPKNGDLEGLRERLEQDAEQLGKGRCEISSSSNAQAPRSETEQQPRAAAKTTP